jgi:hypothetical protein
MWAGVLGRTRLAGCCPSIGAHFFRFSHSAAGPPSTPPPRSRRAARATRRSPRTSPDRRRAPCTVYIQRSTALPWAYFDKRVYANFQDDGYTSHDLAGLCTIVHVQDYRYRSGYITRLILSSRPHLAHDSCGPRSTRWLRKLTPRGSSLSDPAGRTGSIVRTSTATRVCSDDGKRACPRMAGGTASRLSTSCRGRRRNLR